MKAGKAFKKLVTIMTELRGPNGCPWDREQTHESVIPYLIEESHEAKEALAEQNWDEFREEIGDVLCQVVFHALLAEEGGRFTLEDIINGLSDKLVRRHPHVFDVQRLGGSGVLGKRDVRKLKSSEVLKNWEKIKQEEKRASRGKACHAPTVLAGVPKSLPSLQRAYRIGQKAARVGFEFPGIHEVIKKIEEEFSELKEIIPPSDGSCRFGHPPGCDLPSQTVPEGGPSRHPSSVCDTQLHELGDLLFSIVNLARHLEIDPESALADTTRRFQKRFEFIEKRLAEKGRSFEDSTLEEMDRLWEEAKEVP